MIRIALLEEKNLKRNSYCSTLDQFKGCELVVVAQNQEHLLTQLAVTKVDVVVYCWNPNPADGYEPLAHLQNLHPRLKVLLLTSSYDYNDVQKVMRNPHLGYFNEAGTVAQLKKAIASLHRKGYYYNLDQLHQWNIGFEIAPPTKEAHLPPLVKFTKQELLLIPYFFSEMSTEEICDYHCISKTTGYTHRRNILRKTNSKNFVAAIRYIMVHRLLTLKQLGLQCLLAFCLLGSGMDFSVDPILDDGDTSTGTYEMCITE